MDYTKFLAKIATAATVFTSLAFSLNASAQSAATGKNVIFLGADDVCGYCAAYNMSLRKYAKDAGVNLKVVTNKFNASEQSSQVDQAIAQKPDAILLWAIDGQALIPAMRRIKAAGIPLLLTDVQPDVRYEQYWIQYTGGNYEEEGREAARLMLKGFKDRGLGNQGEVLAITGYVGQAQVISRQKGFEEELKKIAPGIKVIGVQPGNWDQGAATTATAGLLTKYGATVKGIYSHQDTMMAGSVVALERAGLDPKKLALVSIGCEPVGAELVKTGKLYGTVLQSPMDEAQYAVESLQQYFANTKMPKSRYVPMPAISTAQQADAECKPWPTAAK